MRLRKEIKHYLKRTLLRKIVNLLLFNLFRERRKKYMYNNQYMQPQFGRFPQTLEQSQFAQPTPIANNPMQYQHPIQNTQKIGLQGKEIENEDIARTTETPFDGSKIYLPLLDGSKIIVKQIQSDGTSKVIVYEPTIQKEKEEIKYVTESDLKAALKDFTVDDIEDMKEELKELRKEFKTFKKEK